MDANPTKAPRKTPDWFLYFLIVFPLLLFIMGIIGVVVGCRDYPGYQNVVSVPAIVSRCEEELRSDQDAVPKEYYKIYANYTYDDVRYENVYIRSNSEPIETGTAITVKISPDDASNPYSGNPILTIISGLFISASGAWGLYVLISAIIRQKRPAKQEARNGH